MAFVAAHGIYSHTARFFSISAPTGVLVYAPHIVFICPRLCNAGGPYHGAGEAAAKGAHIILLQELFETQYFPQVQDVCCARPFVAFSRFLSRSHPCLSHVPYHAASSTGSPLGFLQICSGSVTEATV